MFFLKLNDFNKKIDIITKPFKNNEFQLVF